MNGLNLLDGAGIHTAHEEDVDAVVIGSGPGGAAVARVLAKAGMRVVVLEEGPFIPFQQFPADAFTAMERMYRDMGASVMVGNLPMPFIQGRVVGGTSVINGAISWRIPANVHKEWLVRDPALAESLDWETLERLAQRVEEDLHIAPTQAAVAGPKNLLMAKGADALGLEHRPIRRNVDGCKGLGRCLQGCPEGHKMSMERTYLVDACQAGAKVIHGVHAQHILVEKGRAVGVMGKASGGGNVSIFARHAVVVAASAVHTPVLLMQSGLHQGPVGRHFQCHPGASVTGRFKDRVAMWEGATQGHEVIGLRSDGLKFEVLGFDLAMVASRLKGVGATLADSMADMAHVVNWGAAIRATGEGRVRNVGGRAVVTFDASADDVKRVRQGVRVLGELMLAAGADHVNPGVHGWHAKVTSREVMARLDQEGPLDGRAYSMAVTHMFGTCRMASQASQGVVDGNFKHHHVDGLYVSDSSVFPSNTGVNPQTGILVLASLCGERILGAAGGAARA